MNTSRLLKVTVFFAILFSLLPFPLPRAIVLANGTWNGQDSYFVPMSWCIVDGSPAEDNPNIPPDTDTDAIIWRRHERPTDNIFINPTGISFRSAINNAWGTFNFPIINDTDTSVVANTGFVRGEDVNTTAGGAEFNQLINDCDTAYNNLGRAGIGITAVNAELFHNATGNIVTVIGWGGCAESPAGTCRAPYDGRIMVIDNRYLHPASPNRVWPGSTFQFTLTDPLDQLVGHENGHAMSLDHRNDTTALMNPSQADNNSDGTADNIGLNNAEVTALRANALNVPGVQIDPQGTFDIGRYVATRIPDAVQEFEELPAFLDLASVRVALDKEDDLVFIDQQLFGLLPEEGGEPVEAWFLVDTDGRDEGADPGVLNELGVPDAKFEGADFIARVIVRSGQVFGEAWEFDDNELIQIDDRFLPELLTMVMHPHYAPSTDPNAQIPDEIVPLPLHHIISVTVPNDFVDIELEEPFRVQTVIVQAGQPVVDRLDDEGEEGVEFVVENPSFPECAPQDDGTPGETVPVELRGLLPNENIHGLLGPLEVFRGTTDDEGGGVIDFPIPPDTEPGYHLITVGVDNTALTADCLINVIGREGTGQIPPDEFALLSSHEDLLRRQSGLLENLGDMIDKLEDNDEIPAERYAALVEIYAHLLQLQGELLSGFEDLIRQATE